MRRVTLVLLLVFLTQGYLKADWKQAVAYYNQGKYEKAIEEIKPVVEANPTWETGHRILGLSYLNLKRYEQAESSLARAVQLKSTAFSVYLGLAEVYAKLEKFNKVPEVLTAGEPYAKSPSSEQMYSLRHLRGSAYFRQKRYSEAARDLAEAVKLKPNDFSDLYQLGASYYFAGRYNDAITILSKADAMKPGDTTLHSLLANSYQKQGAADLKSKQYAKAVSDLTKAAEYNQKDGAIYYNLGTAYIFLNKYDEAEKALMRARELLPNNPDILDRLGFIYEKRKQYAKALDTYQKAYQLKRDPQIKASIDRVTGALNPGQ